MIGKRKNSIVLASLLMTAAIVPSISFASCVEFEKEANAIEGAVPKFDDNGKLLSISMYADATFIVPKRSLISKARRKAEFKAKRAFSEWMKEELDSDTVISDMMESTETTDQDGNSSALVTELESQVNNMRGNTKGVLSGLTKLDECVDADEKFVIVRIGWKPGISEAAADSRQKINSEVKRGESGGSGSVGESGNRKTTKITPASGYRKKSKMADGF